MDDACARLSSPAKKSAGKEGERERKEEAESDRCAGLQRWRERQRRQSYEDFLLLRLSSVLHVAQPALCLVLVFVFFRPPEMVDLYKKFLIDCQVDVWVSVYLSIYLSPGHV